MKTRILIIFLLFPLIYGCEKDDVKKDDVKFEYFSSQIIINDKICLLDTVIISIDSYFGGPLREQLRFEFVQLDKEKFNSFIFKFEESNDLIDDLIKKGIHIPYKSGIRNGLKSSTYSMSVEKGSISIYWKKVHINDNNISGEGFIEIKNRIDFQCADSIWSSGGYKKPGDYEYDSYWESYCSPPDYYISQRIEFKTEY